MVHCPHRQVGLNSLNFEGWVPLNGGTYHDTDQLVCYLAALLAHHIAASDPRDHEGVK